MYREDAYLQAWEDVDCTLVSQDQYIDKSGAALGVYNTIDVLNSLLSDGHFTHIDLSNNVSSQELSNPAVAESLMVAIRSLLSHNKHLLHINLAGNSLFEHSAHPCNNHTRNYLEDFVDMLMESNVSSIDLSGNCITGPSRRMLKGLTKLMKLYCQKKANRFTCRYNGLHGFAFKSIAIGLGAYSSLTYLDLSDNFGGLDAFGNVNSEGFSVFCQQLSTCPSMRAIKLARNHLHDDDIILLCNAVGSLHTVKLLDISGNICIGNGAQAVKHLILSHSTLHTPRYGLEHLYLSFNPIGPGMKYIAEAIRRSDTVRLLHLRQCNISNEDMRSLQQALTENSIMQQIDIAENVADMEFVLEVEAEVTANRYLIELYHNALSVDVNLLSPKVYAALSRKLKYLSTDVLQKLHENPSFNITDSPMTKELHFLAPPPRAVLVEKIKTTDVRFRQRILASIQNDAMIQAQYVILRFAMRWKRRRNLTKKIQDLLAKTKQYDIPLGSMPDKYGYK